MNTSTRAAVVLWILGTILVWTLGAWLLAEVFHDPMASVKLPYLSSVLVTLVTNAPELGQAALTTFTQATLGFLLGTLVGYFLAMVMSVSKTAERIAYPYLIISQMIPVLGLAPIIFNLVRDMDTSRIVIAAYITFFPVAANTLSGFQSVDTEKRQLMFSYAAKRRTTYAKLMIPFTIPYLFSGLKIAAPLSVTASILVDMLGSKSGIGVKLLYALYGGQTEVFWASVATSALMGSVSFLIILLLEKILIPWKAAQHTANGGTR